MSKSNEEGFVMANAVYTLDEVKSRLGMGAAAIRQARREGLRVLRVGRRGYVKGSDVMEFIGRVGDCQTTD